MKRPGVGFWMLIIFCLIGAIGFFWVNRLIQDDGLSVKQAAPTTRRVRVAVVDFRNIPAANRSIQDLKTSRVDVAMVWGLGKKDFDKLAADLGMLHTAYTRGGLGVISRWRVSRPKRVNDGMTGEQNISGNSFKLQCGVSEPIEGAMGISVLEGDLASGFETVLKIKSGLNLGITQGWTVYEKGDFPAGQGGWMEIGWK